MCNRRVVVTSTRPEVVVTSTRPEVVVTSTRPEVVVTSTQAEVVVTSTRAESVTGRVDANRRRYVMLRLAALSGSSSSKQR
ncbi:hypothetical protein ATI53_101125 [Salipiger aestuarii]|uniref:Uncharacterized protein n=1 Tax=Salipiger aestuarii TaxID=568098 RepID=A0A327YE13_9RHOB|nr:hypothetical protein ATI53_101125 [Salipiger aestuarii]